MVPDGYPGRGEAPTGTREGMQKPDQVWLQKSDKTDNYSVGHSAAPRLPLPLPRTLWPRALGSRCGLKSPPWRAGHSLLGAGGSVGQGMSAPCRFCSSSQEYQSAQASLTRSFQGKFDKFVVPCVVASGDTKDRKGTEPLSFRCSALGRGAGWSSPCQQPPRSQWGWLRVCLGGQGPCASANPHRSQSPQHAVPGAVVSSGGTIYRGDV